MNRWGVALALALALTAATVQIRSTAQPTREVPAVPAEPAKILPAPTENERIRDETKTLKGEMEQLRQQIRTLEEALPKPVHRTVSPATTVKAPVPPARPTRSGLGLWRLFECRSQQGLASDRGQDRETP